MFTSQVTKVLNVAAKAFRLRVDCMWFGSGFLNLFFGRQFEN